MRPIHFPEANITFNKPAGMTDEECCSISAYQGDGFTNTVWMPNKEDIEAINAGRPIILNILGVGMPPVAMFTCDESGQPNDGY